MAEALHAGCPAGVSQTPDRCPPDTSDAPTSTVRIGLAMLRLTLLTMRVTRRGSHELKAFDAHARWMLALVGEPPRPPDAPKLAVDPLDSYEAARELTLALACVVIRAAAGRPDRERREVIRRAYEFEDGVREMLASRALLCEGPMTDDTTATTSPSTARIELPTAAPGDVIELSGLFGDAAYARVREVVSRGLVVNFTGMLLVLGAWRREVAPRRVFDVESLEPWKVLPPRAPRRTRAPRREAQS